MTKINDMKLKIYNYISAACFFLSSASLLLIPLLNMEDGFTGFAYILAGLFWFGVLTGISLQIFLWLKTRKMKINKPLKKPKLVSAFVFALSVVSGAFVLFFLRTNAIVLPINLFVMLLSAEAFCVIKRMERL